MKTVIADCGSTKADWAIIDNGTAALRFTSTGFNAAVTDPAVIRQILRTEVAPQLSERIDRVCFYGAGCIGGEVDEALLRILAEALPLSPGATVEVASDLTGAARALFGDASGIACILGTGSNSGLYDSKEIIANTPPLGFILGDEGSGAVLGRRLVSDIYKGLMPDDVTEAFHREYPDSKADVIRKVYREGGANRYLASFCPFLSAHLDSPAIVALISSEFTSFIRRNLTPYLAITGKRRHVPGFIGSVAYHFREILSDVCRAEGYGTPQIFRAPIDRLIDYHIAH